ncbi:MAG: hypothetical protein CMM16_01790 [Rhodospirillaceae bacterium]|nr:hypothetical protein [Rhodospirillaceae bacterium]
MFRQLFTIIVCATITACVGQTAAPSGSSTASPSPKNQSIPTPDKPPVPAPDDQSTQDAQQTAAAVSLVPRQQTAIDPVTLVGMTNDRITALFGMPVFVRRDPPSEFWRYRAKSCVMLLFFYRQNGKQRVNHIETRNSDSRPIEPANCVAQLRKQPVGG